jgi:hypothetical protein
VPNLCGWDRPQIPREPAAGFCRDARCQRRRI